MKIPITNQGCFRIIVGVFFLLTTVAGRSQATVGAAYTFTTLAGDNVPLGGDGVGTDVRLSAPFGITRDSAGNFFITEKGSHTIRKITPAGVATTFAGLAGYPGSADGFGKVARFNSPEGVTIDSAGNLYVADTGNRTIRKITPAGLVTTFAGLAGSPDIISRDGTNGQASFSAPHGICIDNGGNIFVTDALFTEGIIRKITQDGTVTTIAGGGHQTDPRDGFGTAAWFNNPSGIVINTNTGELFVADTDDNAIRTIAPDGNVSTFLGENGLNSPGEVINAPVGLAIDSFGNVFVPLTDYNGNTPRIDVYNNSGTKVASIQAGGDTIINPDNIPFDHPIGMAFDDFGNLVVNDTGNNLVRVVPGTRTDTGAFLNINDPEILVGRGTNSGSANGSSRSARFNHPQGIAVDNGGYLFVADTFNHKIRKISPAGLVTTYAGSLIPDAYGNPLGGFSDGIAAIGHFNNPADVAIDAGHNVYVADSGNNAIRKITTGGLTTTIAGWTNSGFIDGVGTNARFAGPFSIAIDASTNLFVSDGNGIRQISPAGNNWVVTTVETNSHGGLTIDSQNRIYCGDGLVLTFNGTNWVKSTNIYSAFYLCLKIDSAGNLFSSDGGNMIRKLVPVVTPAGTTWQTFIIGGSAVSGSVDGTGPNALFNNIGGLALDKAGNIYVADTDNNIIRKGVFQSFGQANLITSRPPSMDASLTVNLAPAEANGQWHFPWELGWHNSGDTVSNLVAGNYSIEFRNMPGWVNLVQSVGEIVLTNNGNFYISTNIYFSGSTPNTNYGAGTLVVNLGINPPAGAGWRFIGDNGSYLPTGFSTNLLAGTYLIEFAAVNGRTKPSSLSLAVNAGQSTAVNVSYLLANSPPANTYLPFLVPAANVTNISSYPFGFNGQLQSDIGYGSGVAVSTNVVLTAAHLIFNDQTLNYVSRVHWFFQREVGVSEPLPQAARGWYVLSGYAAQRTNDLQGGYSPDQSTPPSRNLDVAALYFLNQVAGGGHGGYLPSDAVPNTWLTSTALKMLAGYPVDGSQFGTNVLAGQMYQTDPQPYPLTLANDVVPGQQEVYQAPWFFSYPGNSGGPLYVQLNGYYYPAAVYLGTLFSGSTPTASLVRAIDSSVVNLITNAQALGDSGTNNTGGGVVVLSSALSVGSTSFMQWQLGPPSAVKSGAAWKLASDSAYATATNYTILLSTTNAVSVQFKPINGWITPTNQNISVPKGQFVTYGINYTVSNPMLVFSPQSGFGFTGTTGTAYRIEMRTNLVAGVWTPVSTNTITNVGFNLFLPKSTFTNRAGFYRAVWLSQ